MKLPSLLMLCSALTGALFLTGCTSYQVGNVQLRDLSQYGNTVSTPNVSVAAELYATEAKTKEGFHVNVNEKDYYPVQIIVQNQGAERLLLLKDDVLVTDTSGNEYRAVKTAVMVDEFEHNKMAYALLGFGIFSYMSADEANKKMASDWQSKELGADTIINPGRKSSGFLYFKMPKGVRPTGMHLMLKLENMQSKETADLKLQL